MVGRWCDSLSGACFQRFYDPRVDTTWGYAFPPTPNGEFIGIYIAPVTAGWIGASLGGGMENNPLILTWVDGTKPMLSVRYTT